MEHLFFSLSGISGTYHEHTLLLKWLKSNLLVVYGAGLWLLLWIARSSRDSTRKTDLWILIAVIAWHWRNRDLLQVLPFTFTAVVLVQKLYDHFAAPEDRPPTGEPPWILPSRTTHTRLFPRKHSFAYSYLQVAVPVGSEGRFGSLISVGRVQKKGWYHVQASDYLERNSKDDDLKTKLGTYLRSQGVADANWDHAYLITAPRFLGYSFNPVSFWYVYSSENVLTMMILEVNNTFDERRMYLLRAKSPGEKSEDGNSSNASTPGEELPDVLANDVASDGKFRNAWTKDFHVSPFNSRKGYYMLTASDPFHAGSDGAGPTFSNRITLKSSKDHVKLVANVFSDGAPLNPLSSTWHEMAIFIISWFWVGFLTFPRILKEAAVLFWARGLHVWFRPEVMPTSIGRKEERIETDLEYFFEAYLKHLVSQHPKPINVLYASKLNGSLPCTYTNIAAGLEKAEQGAGDTLEIRVLSPMFFARFVHYAHSTEGFDRECVFTDEKNRTIWISRPDLLYELLKCGPSSSHELGTPGFTERLRWNAHKVLRCSPGEPAYSSMMDVAKRIEDIRELSFSPLDRYVMANMRSDAARYRKLCARLFLSQRLAFGFVQIIDTLDVALRTLLVWKGASMLMSADLITTESVHSAAVYAWLATVHAWAFLKGT